MPPAARVAASPLPIIELFLTRFSGTVPHTSIGLEKSSSMEWFWGEGDSSFFRPSWESDNHAFWSMGLTPMRNDTVHVVGNRVE